VLLLDVSQQFLDLVVDHWVNRNWDLAPLIMSRRRNDLKFTTGGALIARCDPFAIRGFDVDAIVAGCSVTALPLDLVNCALERVRPNRKEN
jgi:hypothetical protein